MLRWRREWCRVDRQFSENRDSNVIIMFVYYSCSPVRTLQQNQHLSRIVDYDILVFNLTHCVMCTTHVLTAFSAKSWMTFLTQLFVFIEFRYTFKYWYRNRITGIMDDTDDKWTASEFSKLRSLHECMMIEDAEIILSGHRPGNPYDCCVGLFWPGCN